MVKCKNTKVSRMSKNIIDKLKKHHLLGRGGAAFPTYLKWQMVKDIKADKKYIVCNGSEGEPNTFKDGFILQNYPEKVVEGVKIALKTIDHSLAYIYLRKDYYKKYKKILEKLIGDLPIIVFEEKGSYLSGEETVVVQEIEGKLARPRQKPPFPGQAGVHDCPTLINNLETFYHVANIADNKYEDTRFYSLSGHIQNKGVFELPANWSIKKILEETNNLPSDNNFFVQSGGGASGEVLLPKELDKSVGGVGAIIVYDHAQTDLYELMREWLDFFMVKNCDKCTPCREGTYRLREMIKKRELDQEVLKELFFVLDNTSFCALGKSISTPLKGLIKKLLK